MLSSLTQSTDTLRRNKNNGQYNFQVLYWEKELRTVMMPHCESPMCDVRVWEKRMKKIVPLDYAEECLED